MSDAATDHPPLPLELPAATSKPRVRLRTHAAPGRRRDYTFSLPPALIADIDEIAAAFNRTRAHTIEMALRQFIDANKRRGDAI
jgi:hypothetical protein